MFINTAVSFIAGLAMLVTPVQPVNHCAAGITMSGIAQVVGSNLMENSYQIAVEIDNSKTHRLYLLSGATKEVAQTAGKLLGEKVHFTGVAVGSDNTDCSVVWLTNWHFNQ